MNRTCTEYNSSPLSTGKGGFLCFFHLPPKGAAEGSTLIESVWSSIEALEVSGCVGIGDDGGANGGAEGDFKSREESLWDAAGDATGAEGGVAGDFKSIRSLLSLFLASFGWLGAVQLPTGCGPPKPGALGPSTRWVATVESISAGTGRTFGIAGG